MVYMLVLVEPRGIEPLTSCMPWAKYICNAREAKCTSMDQNEGKPRMRMKGRNDAEGRIWCSLVEFCRIWCW